MVGAGSAVNRAISHPKPVHGLTSLLDELSVPEPGYGGSRICGQQTLKDQFLAIVRLSGDWLLDEIWSNSILSEMRYIVNHKINETLDRTAQTLHNFRDCTYEDILFCFCVVFVSF